MTIDENRAEYLAIVLTGAGLVLTLVGIDGPLIAGSVLCGAILISRRLEKNEIGEVDSSSEDTDWDKQTECEPVDADNPCNPPENPKNQLDD